MHAPLTKPARRRPPAWLALFAAPMLLLVLAQTARADAAVLLPPSGDEALVAAQRAVHDALERALLAQGLRVLDHDQAAAEAQSEEARDCKQVDCAPLLLREVSAQLAVGLAVWSSDGAQTVFVTLVDARGHRFPGHARAERGDVAAAASAALREARALTLLGPGPWLHVHGEPKGAEVLLAGKVIGTTPMRKRVDSGRYVLEVRKEGHKSFVQSVDVPPNTAKQVEVAVSLQARNGAGAGQDALGAIDTAEVPEGTERSAAWSFVAGGVLAAAGAAALAWGIVSLSESGDCAERDGLGTCAQEVEAGAATTAALIGGGVALAGATVMFAVQPITIEREPARALLSVRGTF